MSYINQSSTPFVPELEPTLNVAYWVPQELIDIIIDNLHDDPVTLRNCSLVRRSWVHPSRRHLFYRIELDLPFDVRGLNDKCFKLWRLYECLQNSPDTAGHTRELRVVILKHTYQISWVEVGEETQVVSAVLKQFTTLTRFEIKAVSWGDFSADVAIRSVIGLSSLTHLVIRCCYYRPGQFASLLSCCPPSLKDLRVTSLYAQDSVDPPKDVVIGTGPRPKLHTLDLELPLMHLIFDWFLSPTCPIDTTTLRNLCVCIREEFMPAGRLVHSAGSSLEHLELRRPLYARAGSFNSIDLSLTPGLKSLLIRLYLVGNISPTSWIQSLFSRVKNPLCLEKVEIHLLVKIPSPLSSEPGLDWSQWRDIDRLLSGVEFGCLRKVTVFLHVVKIGAPANAGSELKQLSDQLTTLCARGILSIISV